MEIAVIDQGSLMMADIVAAIGAATIAGVPVFGGCTIVNDVESFIRVADVLKLSPKPEVGIVEGTIMEAIGSDNSESAVIKLPFDVIVRFMETRKPGQGETAALQRGKYFIEAVKQAILYDPSRNGNANLIVINGEVINGTTIYGTARPLVTPGSPNEAFYAFTISGAVAWSRF